MTLFVSHGYSADVNSEGFEERAVLTFHLIMRKREDLSAGEFKAYYLKRHIPLVGSLLAGTPVSYRQYFTEPADPLLLRLVDGRGDPRVTDVAVVTELSFASRAEAEVMVDSMLEPGHLEKVLADEANFIAPGGVSWVLTER
jgi:hypothetical protein